MRPPDWQTEDGSIRLYRGDCLRLLADMPRDSVDCVLVDPPYSSGGLHKGQRSRPITEKYVTSGASIEYSEFSGDARDQRSWTRWCHEWLRDCLSVTRTNRYLLAFCDWRQLPAMTDAVQWADWTWCGIVPWDKGLASRAGNTSMFRHQCEYVVWATKGGTGGYTDRSGPWPGYFRCNAVPSGDRDHQSEKPVDVLRGLLACCNPGETVLDCFMGSGSSGVAAVQLGLQFVGCELDAEHFDTACRRIGEEFERVKLFEPPPKIVQRNLLD